MNHANVSTLAKLKQAKTVFSSMTTDNAGKPPETPQEPEKPVKTPEIEENQPANDSKFSPDDYWKCEKCGKLIKLKGRPEEAVRRSIREHQLNAHNIRLNQKTSKIEDEEPESDSMTIAIIGAVFALTGIIVFWPQIKNTFKAIASRRRAAAPPQPGAAPLPVQSDAQPDLGNATTATAEASDAATPGLPAAAPEPERIPRYIPANAPTKILEKIKQQSGRGN